MSGKVLYEMETYDWWEFVDWLKSAQERGHATELELALLFLDEERDDPSERMLNAGAYVLGFMELMGIKFLNSHTMETVGEGDTKRQ